jgi:hypothetical protein
VETETAASHRPSLRLPWVALAGKISLVSVSASQFISFIDIVANEPSPFHPDPLDGRSLEMLSKYLGVDCTLILKSLEQNLVGMFLRKDRQPLTKAIVSDSKIIYMEAFGLPIVAVNDVDIANDLLERRSAIYSSR